MADFLISPSPMGRHKYPVPTQMGGRLIRRVVALFKEMRGTLSPSTVQVAQKGAYFNSHILIAHSGGPDSTAMAHLLCKYGRKIIGPAAKVEFLYLHHHWREAEGYAEARFVEAEAKRLGAGFRFKDLKKMSKKEQASPEQHARTQRAELFRSEVQKGSVVFTAHHADDLAETLLWRLGTGNFETHQGGILFNDSQIIRPMLRCRKKEILSFLAEENLTYCQDITNLEQRYRRNRMRTHLAPELEKEFPRWVEHFSNIALNFQRTGKLEMRSDKSLASIGLVESLLVVSRGLDVTPRANLIKSIKRKEAEVNATGKNWHGEIDLGKGWKLIKA